MSNAASPDLAERTIRKISWRVLPLVFLLYVVAFLDRANVAFAKLTMSPDLGFSEAVYGFGAGVFFVGYLLLQIPGALIVERRGGRALFASLLTSWGICAILVGFVRSPTQFYVTRFFLGVAQGGFFPGVLVYLSHWFPGKYRARAMAHFFASGLVALALGGPVSGLILRLNWFGFAGWRWVFIIEALPAVLLGVVTLLIMPEGPQQARWLSQEEREWVLSELGKGKLTERSARPAGIGRAIRQLSVIGLSLMSFFNNIGISGFFLWLPTTVQRASGLPVYLAAVVSGVPFAMGIVGQQFFGWSSDRTGERYLHAAVPFILAGLTFAASTLPGLSFGWVLFWLCMASIMIYGTGPVYWVLPTLILEESAAAAAIGFMNIFSGLGGFVGPTLVGRILTGHSYSVAVFFLSLSFITAGGLTLTLRWKNRAKALTA
jgi:ACS family tartrate transporter-like MFS transporter